MKRIISLILIYFMLMPSFVVLAEEAVLVTEGECRDGLLWSYKDGTLTISGEGEMAHYMEIRGPWDGQYPYFYPKPWAEFSEQVKTIVTIPSACICRNRSIIARFRLLFLPMVSSAFLKD